MSRLRITRSEKSAHSLAEDIDLCLFAFFAAVIRRRGRLFFEGKANALRDKNFVRRFQKRESPADSEISNRLTDDLLDLYGRYAKLKYGGQ